MFQFRDSFPLCVVAGALASAAFLQVSAAKAATESVVYDFCSKLNCTDGAVPSGDLIYKAGTLYGTTIAGGAPNMGTVFSLKLNAKVPVENVLHVFCLQQPDCADGSTPAGGVIDVNGTLYGTASSGGNNGNGAVFSVGAASGLYTLLYTFLGDPDGSDPKAGVINITGTLYGTTGPGGVNNEGTVFSLVPGALSDKVLHSFGTSAACSAPFCKDVHADGVSPSARVIDIKGKLYGTTQYGGANNNSGTVFKIDSRNGAEYVLYSFCGKPNCEDGAKPVGGLIDVNGTLYGTTTQGGARDDGTIFSINEATGAETVLYSFGVGVGDGFNPMGRMVKINGTLYGTTLSGGNAQECFAGCGIVFAFDLNTKNESILYSFCPLTGCFDGEEPSAGLIDVNGTLYGTTAAGGTNSEGTVFSITP